MGLRTSTSRLGRGGSIGTLGAAEIRSTLPQIVCVGDSLTFGYPGSDANSYPAQLQTLLGSWDKTNLGISGYTLLQMISDESANALPLYYSARSKNVLILLGGTNDCAAGATGAQMSDRIRTYCIAAQIAGFRVVACTVPPASIFAGASETARTTCNSTVLANYTNYADGVCDVDALVRTHPEYYYGDGIHFLTTGYAAIAAGMQTAVNALPTAYDAAATSFISTSGISSATHKTAINDLVVTLKATPGLWSKFIALYPFVGGTASAHSYNLVNPAAHLIAWTGGLTHNSNGVTGDGTNVGVTDILGSTGAFTNSCAFGAYNRSSPDGGYAPIGVFDGVNGFLLFPKFSGTTYIDNTNAARMAPAFVAGYDTRLILSTRVSASSNVAYRDGVSIASNATAQGTLPGGGVTFYVIGWNSSTVPVATTANVALAFISTGLTAGDVTALNTAVNMYQTTLVRNV